MRGEEVRSKAGRDQFLRKKKMSTGCSSPSRWVGRWGRESVECESPSPPRPSSPSVGTRSPPSPFSATEGGFDLWKPAGRFTNIKFAFKRVPMPMRGLRGWIACVRITGWIYRVILEEAALEGRSSKKRGGGGGEREKRRKRKKERKKEDPSLPRRRWVFLIGHGKTRA